MTKIFIMLHVLFATLYSEKEEVIYFAGGCFWGVEYYFQEVDGVLSTSVGYIGGTTENPTYHQVCTTNTGHAEAVEVVFNPDEVSVRELIQLFFEIHDFTQLDRQGPDIGKQYRSEIFYTSSTQKNIAEETINYLKNKGYRVQTKLSEAGQYWRAEDYHQQYYTKKDASPYCHYRRSIFD